MPGRFCGFCARLGLNVRCGACLGLGQTVGSRLVAPATFSRPLPLPCPLPRLATLRNPAATFLYLTSSASPCPCSPHFAILGWFGWLVALRVAGCAVRYCRLTPRPAPFPPRLCPLPCLYRCPDVVIATRALPASAHSTPCNAARTFG